MSNPRWKNADGNADVNEIRKLFQQTKFKLPDGQSPQEFLDFCKEHNPERYRELQELAI